MYLEAIPVDVLFENLENVDELHAPRAAINAMKSARDKARSKYDRTTTTAGNIGRAATGTIPAIAGGRLGGAAGVKGAYQKAGRYGQKAGEAISKAVRPPKDKIIRLAGRNAAAAELRHPIVGPSTENVEEGAIGQSYNKELSRHSNDPQLRQQGRDHLANKIKDSRHMAANTFSQGQKKARPARSANPIWKDANTIGKTTARDDANTSRPETYQQGTKIQGSGGIKVYRHGSPSPRTNENHPDNIRKKKDADKATTRTAVKRQKEFDRTPDNDYW